MFGYAFEAIRGGYAALLQLGARQRRELGQMLRGLISEVEPTGMAAELMANANAAPGQGARAPRGHARPRYRQLDRQHARVRETRAAWSPATILRPPSGWSPGYLASYWLTHDDTVALGAVLGGSDLVRFYLSDNYQLIRDLLALPA